MLYMLGIYETIIGNISSLSYPPLIPLGARRAGAAFSLTTKVLERLMSQSSPAHLSDYPWDSCSVPPAGTFSRYPNRRGSGSGPYSRSCGFCGSVCDVHGKNREPKRAGARPGRVRKQFSDTLYTVLRHLPGKPGIRCRDRMGADDSADIHDENLPVWYEGNPLPGWPLPRHLQGRRIGDRKHFPL